MTDETTSLNLITAVRFHCARLRPSIRDELAEAEANRHGITICNEQNREPIIIVYDERWRMCLKPGTAGEGTPRHLMRTATKPAFRLSSSASASVAWTVSRAAQNCSFSVSSRGHDVP